MGIPSFFSWLVLKYPNIVSSAYESDDDDDDDDDEEEGDDTAKEENNRADKEDEHDGKEEDGEKSSATGCSEERIIFDNLYLDMNDIIHTCSSPKNRKFLSHMVDYIDFLFWIVRPRRLLYLAVDGVAPLAKMNKLRQGYFKTTKDDTDSEIEAKLLTDIFKAQGKEVQPRETYEFQDPTVIMPGTKFMETISGALEYYIRRRISTDPWWKDIKVILSDANVPGEGEDKIMSFIRAQQSMESYDPNTRHCIYGHDADLIMLALASHEVHISILRKKPHSTGASPKGRPPNEPHQFLNVWVLREYLELEMAVPAWKHDTERLIDDFIFICLLMGNDYIPRIPSLEIHEFAADLLIQVYKIIFKEMGGYIVNTEKIKDKHAAYLDVSRLEKFLQALSLSEEKIFLKRFELRQKLLCRIQRQAAENEWKERNSDNVEESPDGSDPASKMVLTQGSTSTCISDKSDVEMNTGELWRNVDDILKDKDDLFKNGACSHDRIRLGSPGWKSRFYREKFSAETCIEIGRIQTEMVQKYLEGLCWVLQCYFSEVPSWNWYYPFHYAPFASDLKLLDQFKISFTMGKPLKPFDQLMAALPPEMHVLSCALPKCYSKLIGCKESIIQLFYPPELEIDADGKRFLSQGIAKLPFIDDKLLLSATKTVEKDLTVDEMVRNTIRQERIFLRNSNNLANDAAFVALSDDPQKKLPISTSDIRGWLSPDVGAPNIFFNHLGAIKDDQTISAVFSNPEAVKPIPRLLDNVIVPDKTVTESDIPKRPLWYTYPGARPPPVTRKPDNLWKASSPAMPKEEVKNGGTGWLGRGGGSVAAVAIAAETQQIGRSSYGRERGSAETLPQRSGGGSGYGRGSHGVAATQSRGGRFDGGDGGAYSSRPGGAWAGGGGAVQREQTAWRPAGAWARGGGRGGGGSGQPRAW
ncbi:5'-3' exoribonuclease 3-like isoform X3 [Lolium rigidum]|uniref:5'-3' exoribonuclease 3-like isoform X3 n=1 Tax=Lolium rigidum TaxID=89674 RepID=UPI001F5CE7D5|nr:5'-3' exoribonuclease 3-like isoform X3 [Lolium rigidum]